MEETLDTWLSRQMQMRGIRSIYRLSHEVGVETGHVGDWLLGRGTPQDHEVGAIARFFDVPEQSVRLMADQMITRNTRETRDTWFSDRAPVRRRLPVPTRRDPGPAAYPNSYYATSRRAW